MFKVSGNNASISDSLPEETAEDLEASGSSSVSETGTSFSISSTPDTETVSGSNAADEEAADKEAAADEESNSFFENDSTVTISSGDSVSGEISAILPEEINTAEFETLQAILASEERQELQNEACLSILLFFLIYGVLRLIYRFLRLFF